MRIVFAGTPEFAAEHLKALLDSPYEIVAVYTQPDRPAGRGQKLMPSPVKALAVAHDIPVFQPQTLRNAEAQAELAALKPDLMVVVAYGLILPQAVLDIPRLGCINSHASLLPRWRGAAPIQRAVEAGDAESGVTVMRMEAGLDTGPMLLKVVTPISADDTGGTCTTAWPKWARPPCPGHRRPGRRHAARRSAGRCPGHLRPQAEQGRSAHRLEPPGRRAGAPDPRLQPMADVPQHPQRRSVKVLAANCPQARAPRAKSSRQQGRPGRRLR
jgi:hypothetical protein